MISIIKYGKLIRDSDGKVIGHADCMIPNELIKNKILELKDFLRIAYIKREYYLSKKENNKVEKIDSIISYKKRLLLYLENNLKREEELRKELEKLFSGLESKESTLNNQNDNKVKKLTDESLKEELNELLCSPKTKAGNDFEHNEDDDIDLGTILHEFNLWLPI